MDYATKEETVAHRGRLPLRNLRGCVRVGAFLGLGASVDGHFLDFTLVANHSGQFSINATYLQVHQNAGKHRNLCKSKFHDHLRQSFLEYRSVGDGDPRLKYLAQTLPRIYLGDA